MPDHASPSAGACSPYHICDLYTFPPLGSLSQEEFAVASFAYDVKIARVQRTLRWLEQDASLLPVRLKDLSVERQKQAKHFAASMIRHTRAELDRLLDERARQALEIASPCEPAD